MTIVPTTLEIIAAALFAIAVIHTFSTKFFERLAHAQPRHAGIWHLLGEVEAVFGFWAMVLVVVLAFHEGWHEAVAYLDGQDFTEPLFVFVIMVIAASRPILRFASWCVKVNASLLPMPRQMAFYFVVLSLVPLLGSFITEPAAMTLAAFMLRDRFYAQGISNRLKYATIGVLFVNVSIGGTLTPYAAPPVLMVASKWNWDLAHMFIHFGWKAWLAVVVNALAATLLFAGELRKVAAPVQKDSDEPMPLAMVVLHLLFLAGVVLTAHHPKVFMGLFLFFLGIAQAYKRHHDRLILREGLMVAFFLAGLVALGGMQKWWLQEVLAGLSPVALYYGSTALTAITDNAALTYLGSLVDGVNDAYKYALVAGAVTGGGLTIIANAPNPAGFSILKGHFHDESVHPLGLFLAALPPTLVAIVAFQLL
ncbi:putative Na+/H+ antiporter [Oryzomicrobium sp.]|uniref:putative Na+/H+ antiporter n=1 Tax=Oryzomicrobium sp. TaxID=1911578 RepID=UPI0025EBE719|nr:putative Na+/H+ antiporter [Oryzomicrobium sp.]MCE1244432.1 putative Na+/H+ antiporter [Oryzomicrobium sp.]